MCCLGEVVEDDGECACLKVGNQVAFRVVNLAQQGARIIGA
jgi:hypothetical protein